MFTRLTVTFTPAEGAALDRMAELERGRSVTSILRDALAPAEASAAASEPPIRQASDCHGRWVHGEDD